jgi:hypothetical protein
VTKRMGGDADMSFFAAFFVAMFSGGGTQDWA